MKRKFLLGVLTLFVAFIFTTNVNARMSVLNIPFDTEVKAPATVPADGTTMYSTLTDPFDFSRVQFSTTGGGTFYASGLMRKILLSSGVDWTKGPGDGVTALGSWFAAYCLDGDLKYPDYGAYTSSAYLTGYTTNNVNMRFDEVVKTAMFNNPELRSVLANGNQTEATIQYYEEPDRAGILGRLEGNDIAAKLQPNTVKVASITYDETVITAAQLTGNSSANYLEVTFNGTDIAYLKYTAAKSDDYNKALWIIEHSYPTLDLETALNQAGTSYAALSAEIATLQAGDTNDPYVPAYVTAGAMTDQKQADLTGDDLRKYVENYVYSTVQYAIWKTQGGKDPNNNTIGDSITNVTSLNKLYQYLINVPDLTNYGDSDKQFTNTITIKKPEVGKEIKEEKSDYYIYGPYVASYSALTNDPISLTITNSAEDKANISIVDNSGTVINEVPNGGAFYVKVMKKAKIASVMVDAKVENVTTFVPSSDRARVYNSIYPLTQNVMSGGKVAAKTLTTSETFNYNAKTGVENVAMLLMVTLVAFSLGYMVLSFKAKPIGLN